MKPVMHLSMLGMAVVLGVVAISMRRDGQKLVNIGASLDGLNSQLERINRKLEIMDDSMTECVPDDEDCLRRAVETQTCSFNPAPYC